MKCRANGKQWQWSAVRRGAADQGSAVVERQRQGSGHGSDWRLCAGSQDSGGTSGSASSRHGRGARQRRL